MLIWSRFPSPTSPIAGSSYSSPYAVLFVAGAQWYALINHLSVWNMFSVRCGTEMIGPCVLMKCSKLNIFSAHLWNISQFDRSDSCRVWGWYPVCRFVQRMETEIMNLMLKSQKTLADSVGSCVWTVRRLMINLALIWCVMRKLNQCFEHFITRPPWMIADDGCKLNPVVVVS